MVQGNLAKNFDFDRLYNCCSIRMLFTQLLQMIEIIAAKVPIRMSTNAEEKTIGEEVQLLGAGTVYHDISFIANPLSLGELSDCCVIRNL